MGKKKEHQNKLLELANEIMAAEKLPREWRKTLGSKRLEIQRG
jgi:hypothetical protein